MTGIVVGVDASISAIDTADVDVMPAVAPAACADDTDLPHTSRARSSS
jgi:hypothetical protein